MGDPSKSGEALGRQILQAILAQIPTLFGKLEFLAGLRNEQSGVYEHGVLAQVIDAPDLDRLLRNQHRLAFSEWLSSNLEDQRNDLANYLRDPGKGLRASEGLSRMAAYPDLIPPAARDVERRLYLTDWETLIELLNLGRRDDFSR